MDILEKILKSKKHPLDTFSKATDKTFTSIPRLRSGIYSFDLALGGGLPEGRIITLAGPEHSGKSMTLGLLIAATQRLCKICNLIESVCKCPEFTQRKNFFYVDVECSLDTDWFKALGVDLDRLYVALPEYGEQAVDLAIAALSEPDIDMVVFDSAAALVPVGDEDRVAGDFKIGNEAMLVKHLVQRGTSALIRRRRAGNYVTLLLATQLRKNISTGRASWGQPEHKIFGGKALEHFSSCIVLFSKGKWLMWTGKAPAGDDLPQLANASCWMKKNKAGKPGLIHGEFQVCFRPGRGYEEGQVVQHNTLIKAATDLGLYEGATNIKSYGFCGETFDSKKQLVQRLTADRQFSWETCRQLVDVALE